MQDIRDLLEGLKRSPGILSAFVKSIPESRMDLRRGEGFWTIAEHVSHLAQVQPMLLDRFQRFMNEDHPEFVPYIPGDGKDEPDTPPRLEMTVALEQLRNTETESSFCLKARMISHGKREEPTLNMKTIPSIFWSGIF